MNQELPKTVNIGVIDLGVEFNASYCLMLVARNLGLTSMENQCKKMSRRWPPSTTGIAYRMMLMPRTWRGRCWLFSTTRRRSIKTWKTVGETDCYQVHTSSSLHYQQLKRSTRRIEIAILPAIYPVRNNNA